jgi:hypothetical protein
MTFYGPPAAVLGRAGKARSEPRVPTWDPDAKEPFSRQVFQRTEVGAHRRANPPPLLYNRFSEAFVEHKERAMTHLHPIEYSDAQGAPDTAQEP